MSTIRVIYMKTNKKSLEYLNQQRKSQLAALKAAMNLLYFHKRSLKKWRNQSWKKVFFSWTQI